MTESKIVEECNKINRVEETVTETNKNGRVVQNNLEPYNIKTGRFKVNESLP